MTSDHHPGGGPRRESAGSGTATDCRMLLFGQDPLYLSLLMPSAGPPGFQVLLEAGFDAAALAALRADPGGSYTFDPAPFNVPDLETQDGDLGLAVLDGTLLRGPAAADGTPVATGAQASLRNLVWFRTVDASAGPAPGQSLEYLCFGRGEHVYLVHRVQSWPSFDQVLTVRFVPGTVTTGIGHPLDDDVALIRFDRAQQAGLGRDDTAAQRLTAGQVAIAAFDQTWSPSRSRGFTVQLEVERELYLDIREPS